MSAPIVDVFSKTVFLNNSIAAADLFTAFDSDDAITHYFVQDFSTRPTSGYFELNGVAVAQGSFFKVAAADLVNLRYVGGSQIASERFRIMAKDAANNFSSPNSIASLYTVRENTTAPYSKAKSFSILANEVVEGSDIVWGYDPDGYPIQTFNIRDRSVDFGYFEFDGVAKPQGTFFSIPAEEISKLRYVATGPNSSELFDVIAFDGAQNSLNSVGFADTTVNANRPVVQFSGATVNGLDILPLEGVTTITDADGNSQKKYRFYNTSPHLENGDLIFKGVVMPRLLWFEVADSDMDDLFFKPPNKDFVQQIRVLSYDGKHWSFPSTLSVTSTYEIPIEKPVYTPDEIVTVSEQLDTIQVTSLFSKLDSGPPLVSYEFYDPDTDPASGYFANNGVPVPAGSIQQMTAAEFENNLTFKTGAFYDRRMDYIYVRASNGTLVGDWAKHEIRTEPEYEDVLTGGSDWTSLLPRNAEGDLILTFSFMQQFPDYNTGEAVDNDPPEHFSIFTETQRANARLAFRHIEEIINVQMLEVSDTSTNVFGGTGGIVRMGEYGLANSNAGAFAFFPGFGDAPGDMWFNRLGFGGQTNLNFTPGSWGFKVFLHEFGHAMGLKHPHDGTPRLPPTTDVNDFSVMSYQQAANGEPTTFQLYDVNELQDVYGANMDHNSGDTSYSIANTWGGNQFFVETIWDGGGDDTLSAVGSTIPAVVDLRSGQQSSIGGYPRNVTIALNAEIENGIGSGFGDQMFGNALDNYFDGRAGNDYILGNAGNDMATGGLGDDIFEFGVADGSDIINEMELGGQDTLRITAFPGMNNLEDHFTFKRSGGDLLVDLTLDGGDSQGTVRIKNQTLVNSAVETLELNGVRIDLVDLTSQTSVFEESFKVLSTSSSNGFLVSIA